MSQNLVGSHRVSFMFHVVFVACLLGFSSSAFAIESSENYEKRAKSQCEELGYTWGSGANGIGCYDADGNQIHGGGAEEVVVQGGSSDDWGGVDDTSEAPAGSSTGSVPTGGGSSSDIDNPCGDGFDSSTTRRRSSNTRSRSDGDRSDRSDQGGGGSSSSSSSSSADGSTTGQREGAGNSGSGTSSTTENPCDEQASTEMSQEDCYDLSFKATRNTLFCLGGIAEAVVIATAATADTAAGTHTGWYWASGILISGGLMMECPDALEEWQTYMEQCHTVDSTTVGTLPSIDRFSPPRVGKAPKE